MVGRRCQLSVTLGRLVAFFVPSVSFAQISHRVKKCLPYPTLSDEICDMTGMYCEEPETSQNCEGPEIPEPWVFVDSVRFIGGKSLPPEVRQKLVSSLKAGELPGGSFSQDWLNELGDIGVRGALQAAGYFKSLVKAEGKVLKSDTTSRHVAITLNIKEGRRYRLRSLQFRSPPDEAPMVFSSNLLRSQIDLREGDIFDVSKIREGLESLGKLYRAHGYIDFTPEPDTEIDEHTATIALVIVLDQQVQYRIGKVEVWGPDSAREKLLRSQWKAGEIFSSAQLDTFFDKNKTLLPSDASWRDVEVVRNNKEGTVDLKFDFRGCPQL